MCGEHAAWRCAVDPRCRFIPACAGNTPCRSPVRVVCSVHPRVCGEHPCRRHRHAPPRRFIPACAGNTAPEATSRQGATVHPRVCGEHIVRPPCPSVIGGSSPRVRGTRTRRWAGSTLLDGSSPRVRGTPRGCALRNPSGRFIPACAGNTRSLGEQLSSTAVHPRVCGEHPWAGNERNLSAGSSPRVRGTRRQMPSIGHCARFIPACAGNTSTSAARSRWAPVHPRVCGEHGEGPGADVLPCGSSPRVRGTPHGCHCACDGRRFIPACAGNTLALMPSRTAPYGSSPRVRGTPTTISVGRYVRRFIPACAGNTPTTRSSTPASPVHPRVCGEHEYLKMLALIEAGSSPRVRGTRPRRVRRGRGRRFIPACAGNTGRTKCPGVRAPVHPRVCGEHRERFMRGAFGDGSSPRVRGTRTAPRSPPTSPAVHPRVCGEHSVSIGACRSDLGSSPRVRGTHGAVRVEDDALRFIPACAGNTKRHG